MKIARREYHEGRQAADRFTGVMRRIISVPKEELVKREAEYQKTKPARKPHKPHR